MPHRTTVGDIDADVLAYTAGEDRTLDLNLLEADCMGSAAHVTMLSRMKLPGRGTLLSAQEAAAVIDQLRALWREGQAGTFGITLDDQAQVKKFIEKTKRELKNESQSFELDLRGMDALEASAVLTIFLDNAYMANLSPVRIIHGKGTGVLRKMVHEELRKNKHVKKFRLGIYGEGEDGVTIAELA